MSCSADKQIVFTGHSGPVYALAEGFSPSVFFSGSSDRIVAGWNLSAGTQEKFTAHFPSPVYSLFTLKEKQLLLAGTGAGQLHFIDMKKKEEFKILQLHQAQVFDIAFSPKHGMIFTAGADGLLTVTEEETQTPHLSLRLCNAKVRGLAISPGEEQLAVACGDGTIHVFSLPDMKTVLHFNAHALSANCVCWHPDGNYLLSGGRDAHLKRWDPKNNFALMNSIPAHNYAIYRIVFSPGKTVFATASRDKNVKIWNAESTEFLLRISHENSGGHVNSVNTLLWNPANDLLLSAGDDRAILAWKIKL